MIEYAKIRDLLRYLRECNEYLRSNLPEGDEREAVDDMDCYLDELEDELQRWQDLAMFPAPGVWLVEERPCERRARRISKIGEVPDPIRLASIERLRDDIEHVLLEASEERSISISEIASRIIKVIYKEDDCES